MTKPTTPGIAELLDAHALLHFSYCSDEYRTDEHKIGTAYADVQKARARVLAHVADLERDAARYRWLSRQSAKVNFPADMWLARPDDIDRAIAYENAPAIAQRGGNDA